MIVLAYILGALALLASTLLGIRTYRLQSKVRQDIRKLKAKSTPLHNKKTTEVKEISAANTAPSNPLQALINTSNGNVARSLGAGIIPTVASNNSEINNSYGH